MTSLSASKRFIERRYLSAYTRDVPTSRYLHAYASLPGLCITCTMKEVYVRRPSAQSMVSQLWKSYNVKFHVHALTMQAAWSYHINLPATFGTITFVLVYTHVGDVWRYFYTSY